MYFVIIYVSAFRIISIKGYIRLKRRFIDANVPYMFCSKVRDIIRSDQTVNLGCAQSHVVICNIN